MKKTIRNIFCIAMLGTAVVGCQKEKIEPVAVIGSEAITQQAFTKEITVDHGRLVFENNAHLDATVEKLMEMTGQERVAYENKLGFRSLATIYDLINAAEDQHQQAFFKDVDPDLNVADYERMGLFYKPTPIYSEYLAKGVIEEIVYADRSSAFALRIDNPGFDLVLNEAGEVIVGDRKLVFEGSTHREYDRATNALITVDGAQKTESIYNFTWRIHGSNETASGNVVYIQDPAQSNNFRYYGRVVFTSSYMTSTLFNTFYVDAKAQKKVAGKWATRNNYNPIWGVNASWGYQYWIKYHTSSSYQTWDGAFHPLPNGTPRPTSPYYTSNLNSNHIQTWLHPHGDYARSSSTPWNFYDATQLYNRSFIFNFSGGSSGYSFTAY